MYKFSTAQTALPQSVLLVVLLAMFNAFTFNASDVQAKESLSIGPDISNRDVVNSYGDTIRASLIDTPLLYLSIPNDHLGLKASTPTTTLENYKQGLWYLYLYNYVDAVRALNQVIRAEPENIKARLYLFNALSEMGDDETAFVNLVKATQLPEPKDLSPLLKNLIAYYRIGLCKANEIYCDSSLKSKSLNSLEREVISKILDLALKSDQPDEMMLAKSLFHELNGALKFYNQILTLAPKHIGAHHILVHLYEQIDDYKKAVEHAKILATSAPESAHAQHMYGHVLPKVGKWSEAIAQFEKADKIHHEWFKNYKAKPFEDWHYEHNLDLLAHAYSWQNELKKAESIWRRRCYTSSNRQWCGTYFSHLVRVRKFKEADALLEDLMHREINRTDLVFSLIVLEYMSGNIDNADRMMFEAEAKGFRLPFNVVRMILSKKSTPEQRKSIADYVGASVQQPGFDSWSRKVQEANLLVALAEFADQDRMAANMKLAIATTGYVCKSK